MRLFDIPEDSKIILTKEQTCSDGSTYIIFRHIDGMYSYCDTEKGGVIHLSASAPMKQVDGGYAIAEEENEK
jgi:hypothetical protein